MTTNTLPLAALALPFLLAIVPAPAADPKPLTPDEVLSGLKDFFAKTAKPDGSFRPGIDPDYEGMSDSAYSDLAPVAYAVVIHKTFGWKLPHEEKTRAFLLVAAAGGRGVRQRRRARSIRSRPRAARTTRRWP